MFRESFNNGLFSIFYSLGSDPLSIWRLSTKNGRICRIVDQDINSQVLELSSTITTNCFIACPIDPNKTLGVRLPFLILIIKNMKKYFSFELTILDDTNMPRRFRVSNFHSRTSVDILSTTIPLCMSNGWNQIFFNLAQFTRRVYGTEYVETCKIQINGNVRIRRIYFAKRLYEDHELPHDFILYQPLYPKKVLKKETVEPKKNKKKTNNPPPNTPKII